MQKDNSITISRKEIAKFGYLQHVLPKVEQLYLRSGSQDINAILRQPRLAIVGSRKVSDYGQAVTKKLSYDLAKAGITIVSGLALGVDSLGHRGAIEAGGQTIAVLPCGINTVYPRSHTGIARQIIDSNPLSALISEYGGDMLPANYHFLARNRIIASMSDAVLIAEAAIRSGSLSTANHALELGIPVMAVPGPIDSPTSQGTNNLIKAGAHLVTNPQDVLAIMDIQPATNTVHAYQPDNDVEAQIIELIDSNLKTSNEIIQNSQCTPEQIHQSLTILEIKGVIRSNDYRTWPL